MRWNKLGLVGERRVGAAPGEEVRQRPLRHLVDDDAVRDPRVALARVELAEEPEHHVLRDVLPVVDVLRLADAARLDHELVPGEQALDPAVGEELAVAGVVMVGR